MRDWHRHQDPAIAGELEERVKRWQQSIQPHLEAQESHPAFDIGACGKTILETMKLEVLCSPQHYSMQRRYCHIPGLCSDNKGYCSYVES